MNLTYELEDEKGNTGQTIAIHQGEIKTIKVFWFQNGVPYPFATLTELVAAIYLTSNTSLKKRYSTSGVTFIASATLGGSIGCQFTLSAADTASLPVSSTIGMSLVLTNSTTSIDELDMPSAFNVSAPLVS